MPPLEVSHCYKHLHPYQLKWPDGAAMLMVRTFEAIVKDGEFMKAMPKLDNGNLDTRHISRMLVEFSPICCHLGDDAMRTIREEALGW